MLKHPFEVGARYENRKGTYEVIDINGAQMTIRYENGESMETPIKLQKRIIQNMAIDEEIAEQQARHRKRSHRKRSAQYGRNFDGLVESDFKQSVTGTSWRARSGLGGMLAKQLSYLSGRSFVSRAVPRQPQVYVVDRSAYEDLSERDAKFCFALDPETVYHGLYVEKGGDRMDESWDWLRLVDTLKEDEALRGALAQAMDRYDLHWSIHMPNQENEPDLTAQVQLDTGGLVIRTGTRSGDAEALQWPDFVKMLEEIDREHCCDLFLRQALNKEKVLDLDVQIAEDVANVWNQLLPLYRACAHS